jgi:hypothetical protein
MRLRARQEQFQKGPQAAKSEAMSTPPDEKAQTDHAGIDRGTPNLQAAC